MSENNHLLEIQAAAKGLQAPLLPQPFLQRGEHLHPGCGRRSWNHGQSCPWTSGPSNGRSANSTNMVKYKLLLTGPSVLCFVIFEAFRPTARPLCRGVPFAADEAFVLQSRRALGGDRVGRRRAVPQGPTIPGALSSWGCGALVPPACPGDGIPARRAWGSREEHTWLTAGCSGRLWLEKNGIFFLCYPRGSFQGDLVQERDWQVYLLGYIQSRWHEMENEAQRQSCGICGEMANTIHGTEACGELPLAARGALFGAPISDCILNHTNRVIRNALLFWFC